MSDLELVVQRDLRAPPKRVFDAWTTPAHMTRWWGPEGVQATGVEVDLRVGGAYRIGNTLPSGDVIWIRGVFEIVERPHRLVYTWAIEPGPDDERVTVEFLEIESGTRVVVKHQHIATDEKRADHQHGWLGCLDGLEGYLTPG